MGNSIDSKVLFLFVDVLEMFTYLTLVVSVFMYYLLKDVDFMIQF